MQRRPQVRKGVRPRCHWEQAHWRRLLFLVRRLSPASSAIHWGSSALRRHAMAFSNHLMPLANSSDPAPRASGG